VQIGKKKDTQIIATSLKLNLLANFKVFGHPAQQNEGYQFILNLSLLILIISHHS